MTYQRAFVHRWVEYELQFPIWDDNGNPLPCPSNLRPLILFTHDESVFFQNDQRKTCWSYQDSGPAPKPKGNGQSLIVSDFLMAEWGCLHNANKFFFFFFFLISLFTHYIAGKPASCSNQEKIATDISTRRNSWPKSIVQSTSLRARQMALPRASSCSITHPVT